MASQSNSSSERTTTAPHDNDVLYGRGGVINAHPGNERYRRFVADKKRAYLKAQFKREKRSIIQSIIDQVRNSDPPGRFLLKDHDNGVWNDVGDEKARGKIAQALRENSNELRQQMEEELEVRNRQSIDWGEGAPIADGRTVSDSTMTTDEGGIALQNNSIQGQQMMMMIQQQSYGGRQDMSQGNLAQNNSPRLAPCIHSGGVQQQQTSPLYQQQLVQAGIQQQQQQQTYIAQDQQQQIYGATQDVQPQVQNGQYGTQDVNQAANEQYQLLMQLQQSNTALQQQLNSLPMNTHPPPQSSSLQSNNVWEPISKSNTEYKGKNSINSNTLGMNANNGNTERIGEIDPLQQLKEDENAVAGQFDDLFVNEGNNEWTLHQWIVGHKSKLLKFDAAQTEPGQMLGYTKAALPIILKLAEFLIEAEKDEKNGEVNPVPLESIVAKNLLIRTKELNLLGEAKQEVIEYVWIMRSIGEDPGVGSPMARLCAVGNIIYQLFAGDESTSLPLEYGMLNNDAANAECYQTDRGNKIDNRRSKRRESQSSYSEDISSYCIARLASKGVPFSVRALVNNLIDCGKGDYCGENAYSSLLELKQDLSLMLADPSRFLNDIQVSNGLPTLEICDKLYGREHEEEKLNQLYQQHIAAKEFQGVIVSGGAGVGKSRLAMHIKKLTSKANGYFCAAKFQQNNMHLKPLSIIGTQFSELCERFASDSSPLQLKSVSDELENALGNQAGLLAGAVPSLSKVMPSCIYMEETSSTCVDAPSSMRYLFGELLRVMSFHSKRPISLFIDDLQFADSSSLLLVSDLLFTIARSDSSVFVICCHRDNDPDNDYGMFDIWLSSISMYSLKEMQLDNMSIEGVNNLISDALHLSPRITRELAEAIHHKTMGNTLFVRHLLGSLWRQGYIYVDLSQPRWTWDLKKIADQEISESVLALLMKEMKRLPTNLQLGLKISSCLGSCVQKNILDILSKDLELDLVGILKQVSEKGFMKSMDNGGVFLFAHDKIQQAAYEIMSEQQRRENHMQYGLALCSHSLDNRADNNEVFFAAITQINHGGPSVSIDPKQKNIIASLNLEAGKLSISLSDYTAALSLFEHGISFLEDDKWEAQYRLSLDLFDAAAEAACMLNKNADVVSYTEQIITHATSFDDSLNCLAVSAKSLHLAGFMDESMASCFETLTKLGEEPLRDMDDNALKTDMLRMNAILENMTDDSILNLRENKAKKYNTTMKLYAHLGHVVHFVKPTLLGAIGFRMVELILTNGLVESSPFAFVFYGEVLVGHGYVKEGCRFGKLALKLAEKKLSIMHKSAVIAIAHLMIMWACEPLQSVVNEQCVGKKIGQQTGDFLYTGANWQTSITTSFYAGQSIDIVEKNIQDYIVSMQVQNGQVFYGSSILLYHQIRVLKEGLCALDMKPSIDIPAETEAVQQHISPLINSNNMIHQLVRAYLFRRLDEMPLEFVDVSDDIDKYKHGLRPILFFGMFFEGLVSFFLARQTNESEQRTRWIEKGDKILIKMRFWSKHSVWNWESKVALLEAERMYTFGNFNQASYSYERAIRVAHEHKFINDEAIASELAGTFFCNQGLRVAAEALLVHSVQSYKTWGALAVARRVETFILSKYGSDCMQSSNPFILARIFASGGDSSSSSKKRQGG